MTQYLVPFHYHGQQEQMAYQNCRHNTHIAFAERHYCQTPAITEHGTVLLDKAFDKLKSLCRAQGLRPGVCKQLTDYEAAMRASPVKRKLFLQAAQSLEDKWITRKDGTVKVFIKFEQGPVSIDKVYKPPRLVQYRGTRYCLKLSTWLRKVEHKLYKIKFNGHPLYAKGHNTFQRAQTIKNMERFESLLLGLDHSRFDSHVLEQLLRYEHRFYKWLYKNDRELQKMLDMQIDNRCYAQSAKWQATGGRMSGDFNTSCGNNIVNTLVYFAWAIEFNILDDILLYLDGDDSVAAVYKKDFDIQQMAIFTQLGMTTKLEDIATQCEGISFCQSRPVLTALGWRMVRNFRRVLERLPYTIRSYKGKGWDTYVLGVALCESILSAGVPILWAISKSLSRSLPNVKDIKLHLLEQELRWKIMREPHVSHVPITEEARASYAYAFNVTPTEQVLLEEAILQHDFTATLNNLRLGRFD